MDLMINPKLLDNCDKSFCVQASCLCSEFNTNSIDALYLKAAALRNNALLVSLNEEDFVERLNMKKPPVEVYGVSEFP